MNARVAELVDALDLGSSTLTGVGVRVPPLVRFCSNLIKNLPILKIKASGTIRSGHHLS